MAAELSTGLNSCLMSELPLAYSTALGKCSLGRIQFQKWPLTITLDITQVVGAEPEDAKLEDVSPSISEHCEGFSVLVRIGVKRYCSSKCSPHFFPVDA